MTEMTVGDQTIRYDPDATAAIYATLRNGWAEDCGCVGCRNLLAQRDEVYPAAFKELLQRLGIDPNKESEVVADGPSACPCSRAQESRPRRHRACLLHAPSLETSLDLNSYPGARQSVRPSMDFSRGAPGQVSDDELREMWKARNDARNYIILGDPAVRLNVA